MVGAGKWRQVPRLAQCRLRTALSGIRRFELLQHSGGNGCRGQLPAWRENRVEAQLWCRVDVVGDAIGLQVALADAKALESVEPQVVRVGGLKARRAADRHFGRQIIG